VLISDHGIGWGGGEAKRQKRITVHPVFFWLEMKGSSLPRQHAIVPRKCFGSSTFTGE